MSMLLKNLLDARRESTSSRGIYSVCSAHPWVLRASIQQALADESPLLIEATSNQVNQFGGYTGMRPADFRHLVLETAAQEGLDADRIILGGDHLGPNPWQSLPAAEAMAHAETMIAEYASSGFTKLHLDASMACADETAPLSDEVIAERAARLCAAAESASPNSGAVYIIGTEVPIPGGATESLQELRVTSPDAAEKTLQVHREIFHRHGLEAVWPRIVGMVVQPGVEFNHDSVVDYVPAKTLGLQALLEEQNGLVFEAHSSDYQRPEAYCHLVQDGFAILKVGPALTFAMREVLFALAAIEAELLPVERRSNLPAVMEETLLHDPRYWVHHYHGNAVQQRLLRRYSYSDRMRYYWGEAAVQRAVNTLIANLDATPIPETLLSAYLPGQYRAVRAGSLPNQPLAHVLFGIRQALLPYAAACFPR
jgi:D-tagatose-1,6-bisphosphate aldolase subunit GatZ/KbaZ